jgi:hypothetical protein
MQGFEMGSSIMISAITRELRNHISPEQAREILHKIADSIPEVAQYDVKR